MSGRYILDAQGEPVPCRDLLTWARWFETAERHVGKTTIGAIHVSTVFLGLDHAFGDGPPVLWESMVFGLEGDTIQERYRSRDAAIAGHAALVEQVRRAVGTRA